MTDEEQLAALGWNVKMARQALGITQAELGNLAGLARTSVANVEQGHHNTTLVTILALSRALKVSLGLLVGGCSEMLSELERRKQNVDQ